MHVITPTTIETDKGWDRRKKKYDLFTQIIIKNPQ